MATVVGCDEVVLDAPVEITQGEPSGVAVLINVPAAALFDFDKAILNEFCWRSCNNNLGIKNLDHFPEHRQNLFRNSFVFLMNNFLHLH